MKTNAAEFRKRFLVYSSLSKSKPSMVKLFDIFDKHFLLPIIDTPR